MPLKKSALRFEQTINNSEFKRPVGPHTNTHSCKLGTAVVALPQR